MTESAERVVRLPSPRFPIGYRFTRGTGKNRNRVETVVDYRVTFGHGGEVTSRCYVTEYPVGGTMARDYDVPEATIARGNYELPEG